MMFTQQFTEGQMIRTIAGLNFVTYAQEVFPSLVTTTESVDDVRQQLESDYIDYLMTER